MQHADNDGGDGADGYDDRDDDDDDDEASCTQLWPSDAFLWRPSRWPLAWLA